MPQLWVSYEELGLHLACSAWTARARVHAAGWPRRKCSDGLTRVKLPLAIMADYIRDSWPACAEGDITQVAGLRAVLSR